MKIVSVTKSTSKTLGKVKYFNSPIEAAFHIQSNGNSLPDFNFEGCIAFFDGKSYYSLKTISDKIDDNHLINLPPNVRCDAKRETVDCSNQGGREEYVRITAISHKSTYDRNQISICKDEKGRFYEVGGNIEIERLAPEYDGIKSIIDDAIAKASIRKNHDLNHAKAFFTQKENEFKHAQQELEKAKRELETEEFDRGIIGHKY
jgi:hypothetical protein